MNYRLIEYTENSDISLLLSMSVFATVYSLGLQKFLNLYPAFQNRFLHLLAVQAESR